MQTSITAENILEKHCKSIMDDLPKVDTVLKNIISLYHATHAEAYADELSEVIAVARMISKTYNSYVLLDICTWGDKNPQNNQNGLERVEDIAKYKAALFIREKLVSSKIRLTAATGKKYIIWTGIWPQIKSNIQTHEVMESLNPRVRQYFLAIFDLIFESKLYLVCNCIVYNFVIDTTALENGSVIVDSQYDAENDICVSREEAELVWAADFSSELRNRQQARVKAAQIRISSSNVSCESMKDEDAGGTSSSTST